MRIGIPNRSSFLHLGAVAQCVVAGILPWSEYHPARLFCRLADYELWLCRSDELCRHFVSGDLDVIFTGDDYAGEYLRDTEYESVPYAFVGVHFALLCVDPSQSQKFDRVFTKYPQTAKEHLEQWGVSAGEIIAVSGSSECFACSLPSSAAHDVMCTGATQQVNKLYAVHRGTALGCSWYFRRGTFPESLVRVIADGEMFAKLHSHYQTVLLSRDTAVRNTIGTLLNVTDQPQNQKKE
jgi:ATP phosphoribosyltransferase